MLGKVVYCYAPHLGKSFWIAVNVRCAKRMHTSRKMRNSDIAVSWPFTGLLGWDSVSPYRTKSNSSRPVLAGYPEQGQRIKKPSLIGIEP